MRSLKAVLEEKGLSPAESEPEGPIPVENDFRAHRSRRFVWIALIAGLALVGGGLILGISAPSIEQSNPKLEAEAERLESNVIPAAGR